MTKLSVVATEQSTYIITAGFNDEDGAPVVPSSPVAWMLTNTAGEQISSGTIEPAAEVHIVLSGDDLAIPESQHREAVRAIVVETTYDSSLGSGLPLKESARFRIKNIAAI